MHFSRSSIPCRNSANDQVEQRYVYNSEERLAEVKDATDQTIASYYYDPFGRRLWKTVAPNQPGNDSASPKTTYLYYTDEGYAAEYTHNGNHPNSEASITPVLSQLYLFAPQGLWSTEPLAIKQSGEQGGWRYPETDHLGTPHGLISKDGTETTDLRANAFGQTEVSGEPLPLRFAGQTEDDETGGYYNLFRSFDAYTGRYLSMDPLGIVDGENVFLYSKGAPMVSVDPLGLCQISGQFVIFPKSSNVKIDICTSGFPSCLGMAFPASITVEVSARAEIYAQLECSKRCECEEDDRHWSFDFNMKFEKKFDIEFPIPMRCKLIPNKAMQQLCVLANWTAASVAAENSAAAYANAMLDMQMMGLNPNDLCKKYQKE